MHKVEIWRFRRGGALRHARKFGERACAQVENAGEHGIARLEASDATSRFDHNTCQIAAQRGRKLKPEDGFERAFRNRAIDRIQAGGVNLNENLVRLGHWPRRLGERDVIGSPILIEDERFHGCLSLVSGLCR